ncbi:MAG TPA: triple tyrosine motif-containing protein, partial [Flavobacterium sp.]|nr:triple tyrosine motif-containing protein [Flavobacterium sp.]
KSEESPAQSINWFTSKSIYEDNEKALWLGSFNGLYQFTTDTQFINHKPEFRIDAEILVTEILPYNNNELLITSDAGLLQFNKKTKIFTSYQADKFEPGSISSNGIAAKLIDRQNNIWLGHNWGGGNKSNKTRSAFKVKKLPSEIKDVLLSDVFENHCWITARNGIYKLNIIDNTVSKVVGSASEEYYRSFVNSEGIYFTSSKGLAFVPHSGKAPQYLVTPQNTERFWKVFVDSKRTVWFANELKGIGSYDLHSKKTIRHPYRKGNEKINSSNVNYLDDQTVHSIYEDKQGTIWVGTNLGGINKYNKETQSFSTSSSDKFNRDMISITSTLEDDDGRFWVSTYQNGVFEYDRKTGKWVNHIDEKSGLIFNGVYNMFQDKQKMLWLSSERGLSKLNTKTLAIKNYPMLTYFPGHNISPAQATLPQMSDGKVLINLQNAYATFDPSLLKGNKFPPQVIIEKLAFSDPDAEKTSLTEIFLYDQKSIPLKHNQNRIRFDFIALHFENAAENQYAYKLDGYDQDWVNSGTQRNVTYTNLPPGNYVFRVKASNSDGVWSDGKQSIEIVISPPWWQTWWAYLIFSVLIVGIIWFVITSRSRALKRKNHLLEEKISERTSQLSKSIEDLKTTQSQLIHA